MVSETTKFRWRAGVKNAACGTGVLCVAIVGALIWKSILDDYKTQIVHEVALAEAQTSHASAQLCYAYFKWAEQAHEKSPGMEDACK